MTDFQGASDIGLMETGPAADAISLLQRVRDALADLPASSTEGSEAA